MKGIPILARWSLVPVLAFTAARVFAAPIVISSPEDWNGVLNPREADGVTLSGSGAPGDPAVYTIPDGLVIQSTGAIRLTADLNDENDNANITFQFAGGGLQIDEGGFIETSLGNRNDTRSFILDMGGGSITGAGRIVGLRDEGPRARKPRGLTIRNVNDVALNEIDLHVENTSSEIQEDLTIAAAGQVRIKGMVNYSDTDSGGNPVRAVRIDAEAIEVGGVDTRSLRNGPPGRASGDVVLRALSGSGNFDPSFAGNRFANRVAVNGPIRTDGKGAGGSVTIQGVVVQTGGSFELRPGTGAAATLQAGLDTLGAPRSDLFVNASGSDVVSFVSFTVAWDGVRAPGSAPVFTDDPVLRPRALPDAPYAGTLAGSATDPDGTPLVFARGTGPAWLTVEPNGGLSGIPGADDAGMNTWTISVSDGTRTDIALLRIGVSGGPTFFTDPVFKPKGFQSQPYAGTLSGCRGARRTFRPRSSSSSSPPTAWSSFRLRLCRVARSARKSAGWPPAGRTTSASEAAMPPGLRPTPEPARSRSRCGDCMSISRMQPLRRARPASPSPGTLTITAPFSAIAATATSTAGPRTTLPTPASAALASPPTRVTTP